MKAQHDFYQILCLLQTNLLLKRMNEYFFYSKQKHKNNKIDTSGSFGFKSSQYSQKNNNSSQNGNKKDINPSFFNQSSIKKLNDSQSGEFIYFQNDSVQRDLDMELSKNQKKGQKQKQHQKKKKQSIDYSKQISFDDSLQNTKFNKNNQSQLRQYGIGKSDLPPTLKKPKFGFKISQTTQSSQIIQQYGQEYQIKIIHNIKQKLSDDKKQKQDNNSQAKHKTSKQLNPNKLSSISKCLLKDSQQILIKNYKKVLKRDQSISYIRKSSQQPSIISKSLSSQQLINGSMNFKSVFRNKVQKASSINSSLNKEYGKKLNQNKFLTSFRQFDQSQCKKINQQNSKNYFFQNQVKIAELKDLRYLQNKLGQLKHQNKKIIEYMIQKDQQIQMLKKKKQEIQSDDPYAVIKENQLMKAFLNKKSPNKGKKSHQNLQYYNNENPPKYSRNLHSAKSLKQISIKKSSKISSLHDYDVKQYKFKVQTKKLTKIDKKFVLSNRGMLLNQKYLDAGYSMKDNILTIYLTIKRDCSQVRVKLEQNSLVLSEKIDRVFKNSTIGKQMKFKTQIKSTKCNSPQQQFTPAVLKISLCTQDKFQNKLNQFKISIPVYAYNIARPTQPFNQQISSQKLSRLSSKQVYKTQSFVSCRQMVKNPQYYLLKLFPTGVYQKDENIFYACFLWKQKLQTIKIKIKQRSFSIEGDGNPYKGTFQILRSIVSLLIEEEIQTETNTI